MSKRGTRAEIKRKIDYCIADVVNAIELLDDIFQIYFPNYPDYAAKVETARENLRTMIVFLTLFKEEV